MNTIIHDLKKEQFEKIFKCLNKDTKIIYNNENIKSCIGCFGCWIKSPGKCIIKDGYDNMGEILSKTNKLIIISQCCFGGYSPFIKNVLDRSISYLLPFFKTIDKETHHKQRYKKNLSLSVYFYGKHISRQEMLISKKLVESNSKNLYISNYKIFFYYSPNDLCNEEEIQ